MTHYKKYGQTLVVEPEPRTVEEVSVRELSRDTSRILGQVAEGRRVLVSRRGTPVGVILEVEEAIGLCGTKLLTKQEAQKRLFGADLDEELRERRAGRHRRLLEHRASAG
jgi:prevent-host-death family protein